MLARLHCFAFLAVLAIATLAEAADRPNIILIMADDMGYSDLGCYGGEIETSTLDGLAADGLRFTQFYNTGRCCPTRASLLSGLYPHQAGVGWMMTDRGHDGYQGDLNNNCRTIAEALRPAGYSTYGVGKWHVTRFVQPDGPKHNWPLQRGFDRFYGTITGAGSFFDPGTLTRDNTNISPFADPEYTPDTYYYTDAISDHAVQFIDEHAEEQDDKPFFMYVAYTCAHWPMHALEEDIAKYHGRYDDGYAPIREDRLRRVRELGLVPEDNDPAPLVGDWENFEDKAWESRCMEVYAAMVDNMDRGIGRIVDELEEHDKLDNTLIMFLQDNGGCQEGNGRRGDWQRPVEASLEPIAADAIRLDVVPKQNRAGVPTLTGPGIMPGPEDTYIAYGINWANVSNTPFREYKHFVHEGGISTPLIAHWPAGIERHGQLEHQPGHLIDLMATCVDLAEADYPTEVNGEPIKPLEGRSLAPAFHGEQIDREALYWEHEGNRAIRVGDWKLVAKENRPWELYDISSDRGEQHDLATQMPEKVEELSEMWDAYAERADVLPLGGWRAEPRQSNYNRQQRRFELKPGDDLSQAQAPYVQGRPLHIEAIISQFADTGVIVAQGGSSKGYSLYMQDGRLHFALRHGGRLTLLSSETPIEAASGTIQVELSREGACTVTLNDEPVMQADTPGPPEMPQDGLQVGSDQTGAVGEYSAPFAFEGEIEVVRIRVSNQAASS